MKVNFKNNQPMLLGFGIIAIVAVIAIALQYKVANTPVTEEPTTPDTSAPTTTPVGTPTKPGTTTGALTYEKALVKYKGYMLQFNTQCQSNPTRKTVKNKTTLMLDNRTNAKKTITIDGKIYSVPAYGYSLATFTNSKLPHISTINCGSQNNVAQVTIEQ